MGTTSAISDGAVAAEQLLLYAAGELSPADHAAVERAIASDPAVAAAAADVRSAYAGALAAVAAADAARPVSPAAEAAALRQVGRAVRQWNVDRLARPAVGAGRGSAGRPGWRQLPNWAYATGAAAVLMTAAVAWWGSTSSDRPAPMPALAATNNSDGDDATTGVADATVGVGAADAERLERSFDTDVPDGIDEAETQANALPTPPDATAQSVFLNEGPD